MPYSPQRKCRLSEPGKGAPPAPRSAVPRRRGRAGRLSGPTMPAARRGQRGDGCSRIAPARSPLKGGWAQRSGAVARGAEWGGGWCARRQRSGIVANRRDLRSRSSPSLTAFRGGPRLRPAVGLLARRKQPRRAGGDNVRGRTRPRTPPRPKLVSFARLAGFLRRAASREATSWNAEGAQRTRQHTSPRGA
jgi:hypothetical protein